MHKMYKQSEIIMEYKDEQKYKIYNKQPGKLNIK